MTRHGLRFHEEVKHLQEDVLQMSDVIVGKQQELGIAIDAFTSLSPINNSTVDNDSNAELRPQLVKSCLGNIREDNDDDDDSYFNESKTLCIGR